MIMNELREIMRLYAKKIKIMCKSSQSILDVEKSNEFFKVKLNDLTDKVNELSNVVNYLANKTVVIFGDSIAKGDHSEGGVFARLGNECNVM